MAQRVKSKPGEERRYRIKTSDGTDWLTPILTENLYYDGNPIYAATFGNQVPLWRLGYDHIVAFLEVDVDHAP